MNSSLSITNESGNLLVNHKNFLPCGSIVNYSGDTAPDGWLICNGSEKSKTTYSALFSIIGAKYGAGSTENFTLPDLRDRVPVGYKSGTNNLGDISGNSSITLTTNQMPSHTHIGTTDGSGSHTHTGTTDLNGAHIHSITDPGHTHSQTTINDDYNNSGSSPPGFSADSAGTKTWNNISTETTGISINSDGSHTHTFTTNSNGSHSHSFTTGSSGSGQTIDIRNKYIVLNYIIKY